jgi:hypothetical protein
VLRARSLVSQHAHDSAFYDVARDVADFKQAGTVGAVYER